MHAIQVLFFDDKLEQFIKTLEKGTIAKVLRTIDLLEQFGPTLNLPHSKKVSLEMFELRIRGRQEVRILYVFHRQTAILLHGFVKKSDRIPVRELATARHKLAGLDIL